MSIQNSWSLLVGFWCWKRWLGPEIQQAADVNVKQRLEDFGPIRASGQFERAKPDLERYPLHGPFFRLRGASALELTGGSNWPEIF